MGHEEHFKTLTHAQTAKVGTQPFKITHRPGHPPKDQKPHPRKNREDGALELQNRSMLGPPARSISLD
jgi:hypothetical protein